MKTSSKSATFVQHIVRPGTGPLGCARALCDKKLVVKIAQAGEDFVGVFSHGGVADGDGDSEVVGVRQVDHPADDVAG